MVCNLVAAGRMRADCADLRVLNASEDTELDFWVNPDTVNTAATEFWVKAPSLPVGETVIYLYYGNASASSESDGDGVFELFDDFDGASVDTDKWEWQANVTAAVNGQGQLKTGGGGLFYSKAFAPTTPGRMVLEYDAGWWTNPGGPAVIKAALGPQAGLTQDTILVPIKGTIPNHHSYYWDSTAGDWIGFRNTGVSFDGLDYGARVRVDFEVGASVWSVSRDGVEDYNSFQTVACPSGGVGFWNDGFSSMFAIVDRLMIRKWAAVEPAARLCCEYSRSGAAAKAVTTYTYDSFNKLTEISYPDSSTEVLTYDDDGRLTKREKSLGEVTEYEWSPQDMLVKVILPSGENVEYNYDGDRRLVGRSGPEGIDLFVQSGWDIVTEIDEKTKNRTYYTGYSSIGGDDGTGAGQNRHYYHYYHYNHRGDTALVTDKNGAVIRKIRYKAYGKPISSDGNEYNRNTLSDYPNLFVGEYGIRYDTKTNLNYMRYRWYSEDTMRFIKPDYVHFLNRYSYAFDNPINYIDANGYAPEKPKKDSQSPKPNWTPGGWMDTPPANNGLSWPNVYNHPDYGKTLPPNGVDRWEISNAALDIDPRVPTKYRPSLDKFQHCVAGCIAAAFYGPDIADISGYLHEITQDVTFSGVSSPYDILANRVGIEKGRQLYKFFNSIGVLENCKGKVPNNVKENCIKWCLSQAERLALLQRAEDIDYANQANQPNKYSDLKEAIKQFVKDPFSCP